MSFNARSHFGRVPAETARLLERSAAMVREQVLSGLPRGADAEMCAYTVETVLEYVLRDWRENGNIEGLLHQDVEDLKSFVALAASLAGQDFNGQGVPIYQATLRGLLEDWLHNWNSDGDPGPPGPIN